MRLYRNIPKRLAKKVVATSYDREGRIENRRQWPWDWRRLNRARNLKPGDLVSTCIGFNEPLKMIEPWWREHPTRFAHRVVCDFDIYTARPDGTMGSCSWMHCCGGTLETKEQVVAFWRDWEGEDCALNRAVRDGVDVFTEDGQLKPEYWHLLREK